MAVNPNHPEELTEIPDNTVTPLICCCLVFPAAAIVILSVIGRLIRG